MSIDGICAELLKLNDRVTRLEKGIETDKKLVSRIDFDSNGLFFKTNIGEKIFSIPRTDWLDEKQMEGLDYDRKVVIEGIEGSSINMKRVIIYLVKKGYTFNLDRSHFDGNLRLEKK